MHDLQGSFLALAGFGNLPGDISFWHRKQDGRCDQLGKTRYGESGARQAMDLAFAHCFWELA